MLQLYVQYTVDSIGTSNHIYFIARHTDKNKRTEQLEQENS
jgi:hypothetical protein